MSDEAARKRQPMRILVLAHFAGSPRHGMVYGHYYLAREWVRLGHQVTILAASFAHPRRRQPECARRVCEEVIDGIRYLWLRCPAYDPAGRFGRIANILAFVLQTWARRLPVGPADVVIASSHYPLAIVPARRLARRYGARLVFEVRDLWPLTLVELGGASRLNPFIVLLQLAEDYAYRVADLVVSVLPRAYEYMGPHGLDRSRYVYVPNGVDTHALEEAPLPAEHAAEIERSKARGEILVGYAGNLNLASSVESLIQAIARLRGAAISAVILGDGPARPRLAALCEELDVSSRVAFLPAVEKGRVQAFLRRMDVLYVGLRRRNLYRYGVSLTKLHDYLHSGTPVVCAIDGVVEGIAESGAGIQCPAEDPGAIAEAIVTLAGLPRAEREDMGRRGAAWIRRERDYGVLAGRFLEAVAAVPRPAPRACGG